MGPVQERVTADLDAAFKVRVALWQGAASVAK